MYKVLFNYKRLRAALETPTDHQWLFGLVKWAGDSHDPYVRQIMFCCYRLLISFYWMKDD